MHKHTTVALILIGIATLVIPALLGSTWDRIQRENLVVDERNAGRTAMIRMSNDSLTTAKGNQIQIRISLDDGGSKLNAARVSLVYSADLLAFVSATTDAGICGVSPDIRNEGARGELRIACENLRPQDQQAYRFATARFEVRDSGSAYVYADTASSSLLVRGSNREALGKTFPLSFAVGDVRDNPLTVISRTHPTGACGTSLVAELRWLPLVGVREYLYSWSESPVVPPRERTADTKLSLPVKPGAVHYLAVSPVRLQGGDAQVTRYRVASCP